MIHIGRAGTKLGSFSEEEVRQGLTTGRFSWTDLGWKEGMANWAPLSQFEELTAPPPLPEEPLPEQAEVPATAEPVAPSGLPWDARAERGFLPAFVQTARLVLLRPAEAFAWMRIEGSLLNPLLYNLLGGWLGLIASGIYAVLISRMQQLPANTTQVQQLFDLTPGRAMQELKWFLIMGPILVTVSALVCSGIAHLFLMLAGGANKPYHVTLRVFCFSYGSAQLLQLIPFCGSIVAPVWLVVCCAIGLAAAHRTTTGRSMAAMALFLVTCCLCCLGIFFLALGASYQTLRPLLNQ
jgi:hypothetical protein